MVDQQGAKDIRGENINSAVKGFAMKKFKLMQVLQKTTSNKWTETYYRENATILTASGTRNVKGVSRGAVFPHVDPSWTKYQGQHLKHASEGTIYLEDKMTDNIDVQARTLIRVAEAIAESVDQHIYDELSGATSIGTAAASNTWDNTTESLRKPIDDILAGIQSMEEQNYDALENGYLLLTPKDYRSLLGNSKVINNPSFKTADVVSNGKVGQICGLTIIKSRSVDDDEAMIIIGQKAATWRSAQDLTTAVIEDTGIKYTIRAWLIGQVQVTDPKAIYLITNTQN